MSGRDAIRGFAIQTLICLLDSLWEGRQWTAVTLEPDSDNDKVDIYREYDDGSDYAQQVKSSKNQISKAAVLGWCRELKESRKAKFYQLILAGPIASSVLDDSPFDDVDVPTPASIDSLALLDQAITKVDRYLTSKAIEPLPLALRESLVYELVARMFEAAISGRRMSREEFDGWLLSGITSSYPLAVKQRLTTNCSVLWSVMEIAGPLEISKEAFELILPITVVNGGAFTAVVELFLLRVWSSTREMRYRPDLVISENSSQEYSLRRIEGKPFGDFAISPHSSIQQWILFVPIERPGYATDAWPSGDYHVELFVKFSADPNLIKVKRVQIQIGPNEFSVLGSKQTKFISVSNLEKYLDSLS